MTNDGTNIENEWEDVEVDVTNKTRNRRRQLIEPKGSIPLVFALRRWHLASPLMYFEWPSASIG